MSTTETIDTVVVGAGQAGLAASRCLADRGVDHVVLERGRVAERWHSERWDSLRLLTPNWMSRLPGWSYAGHDPDGYMTAAEVAGHFQAYAEDSSAPVCEASPVRAVRRCDDGLEVVTDGCRWLAVNVVIATGWCDLPNVPTLARRLDPGIAQITPSTYRNPRSLPAGGVLVVGASATGLQLADELRRDGRDVVLAAGRHSRLPRRYRGMDVFWWLDRLGTFDRTIDEVPDPVGARREPSLGLVGRPDHADLDLATLAAGGVEVAGRLAAVDGGQVGFATDLAASLSAAEARMARLLDAIDRHIDATGLASEVLEPSRPAPVTVDRAPDSCDLRARRITAVVWATGYRRSYPWLHIPVLDQRGEIRQQRGVTPVPGLYVLGQRFQQRRSSNLIDGVGLDAVGIASHVARRPSTHGLMRGAQVGRP